MLTERSGEERIGRERKGLERRGQDRNGLEWIGKEWLGSPIRTGENKNENIQSGNKRNNTIASEQT